MNDTNLKISPQVSHKLDLLNTQALEIEADANATTVKGRIPLMVRSRTKVLRVAPPIDDGFRPFRVF